jgi:glutaryl-CoA dehydrogenase (non-decarboxylating)
MEFEFSTSDEMLRKTVRDFLGKEVGPQCGAWEEEGYLPMEIIRRMGELGFYSCIYPAQYGGTEMGWLSNTIVSEELGREWMSLASTVSNPNCGTCPMCILIAGNEDQKSRFLPRLNSGEILGCFSITEPNAGTDAASLESTARLDGDYYSLNGTKTWATNCTLAGVMVVFAKTSPELKHQGISAFLLEPGMPGLTTKDITGKMGVKACKSGYIYMDDCRVPKENLLGQPGEGWMIFNNAVQYGRILVAARAVGLAQACLEASLEYSRTREQFGQKIGKFQMIKYLIAEMVSEIEAARLVLHKSACLANKGQPFSNTVNIAKFLASEAAAHAAKNAQQVFGAYGYSTEYPVARYFRDSMLLIAGEGSNMIQRVVIANDALGFKKAESRE